MPDALTAKTDNAADDEKSRRAAWLAGLFQAPGTAPAVPEAPRQRAEDFKPVPSNLDSAISGAKGAIEETVDRFTPGVMKDQLPKGVRLGKKASDALGDKLRAAATSAATGIRDLGKGNTVDVGWDF